MPIKPPTWLLLALTLAAGCEEEDPTVCDPVVASCNECYDGDVTCTYDDVSVTEASCDGCQARQALYEELCALGRTDTRAEVEAGMVCEPADTE